MTQDRVEYESTISQGMVDGLGLWKARSYLDLGVVEFICTV